MTEAFIARWEKSGAAERANYQPFLIGLCGVLGVDPPEPSLPDESRNTYVFEKSVRFPNRDGTLDIGRADLYKRGHFLMETKQGANEGASRPGHGIRGSGVWDQAMVRAKNQGERYVRALPPGEGRPPFLLVVDVGYSIEVYAEFSRTGGIYTPFPDASRHRILVRDLAQPGPQDLLRRVWTAPESLDPALHSARVTREISAKLAGLARSLEASGHPPRQVGGFLMRSIFTMFAEDVGLLPRDSFRHLLEALRDSPGGFVPMIEELWRTMDQGGFCIALQKTLRRFNGGFFEERHALSVTPEQLDLLLAASRADWRDVEPAIFGTLLERALDPRERHKLGAHYTPRGYVERLVVPTVVEPLRAEWDSTQAAVSAHLGADEPKKAVEALRAFHHRLCNLRVLDPACGSGNFLYVTLEHLKRLEAEVLELLSTLGEKQDALFLPGHTVHPEQFLGLEINPRAAVLAELCLWIGYLQNHLRARGSAAVADPVISKFHTIEHRDAVLQCERTELECDAAGKPLGRWDGITLKPHAVTGESVPDETALAGRYRYVKPSRAKWPDADFVVGNPPFIGAARMRAALGDGYVEALRALYPEVPESADFVMYWWHKAAVLARTGKIERFGFITTNSLRQTFNRRVLEEHLAPARPDLRNRLALVFAIPDHPWVENADGAAVRIAMTVGVRRKGRAPVMGVLKTVIAESKFPTVVRESTPDENDVAVALDERTSGIHADLTIGADVAGAVALLANADISNRGVQVIGSGFIVTREEAAALGLDRVPGIEQHLREYRNGKDLTSRPRDVMVIDLFGLTESEVRNRFPELYQWVYDRVKPERDANKRDTYRRNWWIHGEPRSAFRPALAGLPRYIATVETSKHRFFQFLDASVLPDNKLICIAHDDAYVLGVLSSRIHVAWALAAGSWLGVGNDPVYVKSRCFETFPFPDATESQKARIRDLAERLDAHRKRQLALHPTLTMTDLYNVLEAVRAGETLTAKHRALHEQGLVTILRQLHDELDAAVAEAYGWDAGEDSGFGVQGSGASLAQSRPMEPAMSSVPPALSRALSTSDGKDDVPCGSGSFGELRPTAGALDADAILDRLVALNRVRAEEEARGTVRYLRPEYQAPVPGGRRAVAAADDEGADATARIPPTEQSELALPADAVAAEDETQAWPKELASQIALVRDTIARCGWQASDGVKALAKHFTGVRAPTLQRHVDALVALGQV